MKKVKNSPKAKRHIAALKRYSEKRRSQKWIERKANLRRATKKKFLKIKKQVETPYVVLVAPTNFGLIENTNEVLEYFKRAEKLLSQGKNVTLDISKVEVLTSETVAMMVASVNDIDFTHDAYVDGNEPEREDLRKLFTESGFYDHVQRKNPVKSFSRPKGDLLHKEVDRIVVPKITKAACITGFRHVFGDSKPFKALYEIISECMLNTQNHADLKIKGKCNWWLYVHNYPNQRITSYSFLDLGVGIFKSVSVQNYYKKMVKGTILFEHINLVDDLLGGKIKSRIKKDNEIRGKGIPQIVRNSKSKHFKSFYIITNDVKINLKSGEREKLEYDLDGTFLFWELTN